MKYALFLCLSFLFGCVGGNGRKKAPAVYDPAALIRVISLGPDCKSGKAAVLDSVLRSSATDSVVFCQTVNYLEKVLSDPNSSYRNDEMAQNVFRAELGSRWIDKEKKAKIALMLRLLQQNAVGTQANDFVYLTPIGERKQLFDISAGQLLLFFYNPECEACREMKRSLLESTKIAGKISKGELKILAVYVDDDEKTWRRHLPEQPPGWLQGKSELLFNKGIYDLRAIPSLYLLDGNKRVVLKDCLSVSEVEGDIRL